jgi:uncharacterized membrane protein YeaQ/YmgE (transglycosylase-associated protein family)
MPGARAEPHGPFARLDTCNRPKISGRKQEDHPMNFIIWLIIGGVIGWLASIVMRTDGQQGIFLNIVVGIVGSYIGGFLFGPMLGSTGAIGPYLSAFLGAIVLLAIVNLVRRGTVR